MFNAGLLKSDVTSWASFGHGQEHTGLASNMNWQDGFESVGNFESFGNNVLLGSDQYQYAMYAASMAQGEPFLSDAWNWVKGQVSNLYDNVYNWVSDNVSMAPIGIFSTLATVAPYAIPGVKFEVPTGLDPDVLALLSGSKWSSGTISYSLPDSRSDYQWINPSAQGYKPLTFDTEQAVRYALEGYSPYAGGSKMGLTSVEGVTNLFLTDAGRDGATLQVSGFTPNDTINRSHGYYPGVPIYGGDVWLTREGAAPGSYSYMIVLHELGHALGLKHSHDSGGSLPTMSAEHDSPEFTVMSYGELYKDYPQTYMQYDVAALQAMYGADFTTNSGNTVYKWSPQTGETFVNGIGQGTPALNAIFLTIWDGGGTDTYDVSNYSGNASIDLAAGGYVTFSDSQRSHKTSGAYVSANVYNAFQYNNDPRSLIENAVGGAGHDKIYGNTANNTLTGNAGNDTLTGADGNDTLLGGDGADQLMGGAGADHLDGGATPFDTLVYGDSAGSVYVDLLTNVVSGGTAAGDRISNFENVFGGRGADQLYGNSLGNVICGDAGNDILFGRGGADYLDGGAGNDFIYSDGSTLGAPDTLVGGAGNDTFYLYMSASRDTVIQDFNAGFGAGDVLILSRWSFADFDSVKAAASQSGSNVVIDKPGLYHVLLKNVALSSLAVDDFAFL